MREVDRIRTADHDFGERFDQCFRLRRAEAKTSKSVKRFCTNKATSSNFKSQKLGLPGFLFVDLAEKVFIATAFPYLGSRNAFFSRTSQFKQNDNTGETRPNDNIRALVCGENTRGENCNVVFEIYLHFPIICIIQKTSPWQCCWHLSRLTRANKASMKIFAGNFSKNCGLAIVKRWEQIC